MSTSLSLDHGADLIIDATVPYFNWSCAEIGLIIMTASVPLLRPFLATILPDFFKEHNFTSLFAHEKRMTMVSSESSHKLVRADDYWTRSNTGRGTGTAGGFGTIVITTEYQIEEAVQDSRPKTPGTRTPCFTPLAQKFGPRAVVTCEKAKSPF